VHRHGDVRGIEHTDEGTRIDARVPAALAGELEDYAVVASS